MADKEREQDWVSVSAQQGLETPTEFEGGLGITQEYNKINRDKYWDSAKRKAEHKEKTFGDKQTYKDPVSGKTLHKSQTAARKKYHMKNPEGENISKAWAKHSTNTDHIVSLKRLTKLKISDYAHGFVKNRSIRTNAELHMTHDYALCMDIEDFFPSIKEDTVKEVFARAGYSRRAANALADMCCYFGALPQGAPTSPYLANLVFIEKDHELALLAKQHNATYSRYADDLTFSSDNPLGNLSDAVNQVLQNNGFRLNDSKTKEFFPGQPKRITGLIVQNGLIRVPRKFKRTLKQEIYYCKKYGVALHLENTRAHKTINYREYLYGKAYYINMIEPELGKHYLKQLDEIHWPSYYL